jgi:hypothetical protein
MEAKSARTPAGISSFVSPTFPKENAMTVERGLQSIAGTFIAASVALAVLHSPWWLAFTAFVGVNLFQSGFTNWCPMVWILQKAGLRRCMASQPA